MRRRWAVVLAVGALLALSGCSRPSGTDGDLTNAWAPLPKAVTPVPQVGVCYTTGYDETWYGDFSTAVDCAGGYHQTETVYVGAFTGADADRSAPPLGGSAARKAAYQQCQSASLQYLGGDWQAARAELGLVLPDDKAWAGGARWYRCDVTQYKDSNGDQQITSGSVKDGMRGSKPLAITCLTITDDGKGIVKDVTDVTCDKSHNVEFIGLFTAPDGTWQADDKTRQKAEEKGCEGVLSTFLGYGGGTPYSNYVGWWAWGFQEDQWKLGDRTERCFAVALSSGGSANNVKVVGSMKGLRSGAPKRG